MVLLLNKKYHDDGSCKTFVFISNIRIWSITFQTNYNKRSVKKYFVLKTLEYDGCFITKFCSNMFVLLCVCGI